MTCKCCFVRSAGLQFPSRCILTQITRAPAARKNFPHNVEKTEISFADTGESRDREHGSLALKQCHHLEAPLGRVSVPRSPSRGYCSPTNHGHGAGGTMAGDPPCNPWAATRSFSQSPCCFTLFATVYWYEYRCLPPMSSYTVGTIFSM